MDKTGDVAAGSADVLGVGPVKEVVDTGGDTVAWIKAATGVDGDQPATRRSTKVVADNVASVDGETILCRHGAEQPTH